MIYSKRTSSNFHPKIFLLSLELLHPHHCHRHMHHHLRYSEAANNTIIHYNNIELFTPGLVPYRAHLPSSHFFVVIKIMLSTNNRTCSQNDKLPKRNYYLVPELNQTIPPAGCNPAWLERVPNGSHTRPAVVCLKLSIGL
jgi:hypothetical protein